MVVLYHRIMRRENFEKAAKDLFKLLITAQTKTPNEDRALYVDIDDHKNSQGGLTATCLNYRKNLALAS